MNTTPDDFRLDDLHESVALGERRPSHPAIECAVRSLWLETDGRLERLDRDYCPLWCER
jgi:hypothetical protein